MERKFQTPMALPPRPVRITLPAAVAYDLTALQKGIAVIAERLGCQPCFSGANCTFQLERDFVIDEKLQIGPRTRDLSGPTPQPWEPQELLANRVSVTLPATVSYNLEQIQEVVAKVAGRLGCAPCCSGFDITFLQERELIFDEALNIRSF